MKESNIIKIKKMIAVSAAALTAFSLVSCGDAEPAETKKVFADGVSVENIDISGLTMDEGILKLTEPRFILLVRIIPEILIKTGPTHKVMPEVLSGISPHPAPVM